MNETIDVKENSLLEIDKELLDILLKDQTTGRISFGLPIITNSLAIFIRATSRFCLLSLRV